MILITSATIISFVKGQFNSKTVVIFALYLWPYATHNNTISLHHKIHISLSAMWWRVHADKHNLANLSKLTHSNPLGVNAYFFFYKSGMSCFASTGMWCHYMKTEKSINPSPTHSRQENNKPSSALKPIKAKSGADLGVQAKVLIWRHQIMFCWIRDYKVRNHVLYTDTCC